jgi:hypothetical protein
VGAVPLHFAATLRDRLGLRRAIESGTYAGEGARRLAQVFPVVVTIEIMPHIAAQAKARLEGTGIQTLVGDSVELLPGLRSGPPTFYWLDGHWSGGDTGGAHNQCPVLNELGALEDGDPLDCILIDDARLYLAAPPPLDRSQWPTIGEVFDRVREVRTGHHVTIAHDIVVAVPERARDLADAFVLESPRAHWPWPQRAVGSDLARLLARLDTSGRMEGQRRARRGPS